MKVMSSGAGAILLALFHCPVEVSSPPRHLAELR
jgi:hypothetical protein